MPWGDRAVAAARKLRLRKFQEQERKAEVAWQEMRHDALARVGSEGVHWRLLRWWHLQKIGSGRQVAIASIMSCALTLAACWFLFSPAKNTRRSPKPSARSPPKSPNERLPRSATTAPSAMSNPRRRLLNHGGVQRFFIGQ